MKKRKIFSLAPHERFNYGDIMYSIILKEIFKNEDFYHLGINAGDFTEFGSGKMFNINILKDVDSMDDNLLFIGGGEFLGCSYEVLFSFIHDPKPFDNNFKTPFIHDEFVDDLPIRKFYISFGGSSNNYISRDLAQLEKADIIYTRESLTNANIKSRLKNKKEIVTLPDLVTLSSYFFPRENKKDYIVIQLGKYKTPTPNKIIELIMNLQSKHKIKLVGLGNCAKHDDDVILEEIYNILPVKDNVELVKPKDALEIMNIISSAKLCIGTSLHLMITSFSYNIPWVNYNSRLYKITNYKDQWYPNFGEVSDGFDLIDKVNNILKKSVDMTADIDEQQSKIINFFNKNVK